MSAEREPSLKTLRARRSNAESSLSWRKSLLERIGQGEIREEDSFEATVKIGRIRKSLSNSFIPRAQSLLESLDQEIEAFELKQQGTLLQNAQEYLDEVSIRREQLRQIREYANDGFIKPEILERRELEFKDLASKPGREPKLKEAIDLFRSRKEQGNVQREAEPKVYHVIVDRMAKTATIDGQTLKFRGTVIWETFKLLATHAPESVTTQQLKNLHRRFRSRSAPALTIFNLKFTLKNQGIDPVILTTTRVGRENMTRLNAKVEFVTPATVDEDLQIPLPNSEFQRKYLTLMKKTNQNKGISTDKIARAIYGTYDRFTAARVSEGLRRLNKFLNAHGFLIVQTTPSSERSKGKEGEYFLQKIPLERETKQEEEKREESEAFFQSRLDTLNFMVENPDAKPHQILQKLGLDRKNQPFNRGNGPHAIRHAVQRLARRVITSEANDQEVQTFENISSFMSQRGLADLNEFLAWNYAKFRISPRPLDIGESRTTVETTPEILETAIGAQSLVEEEVIGEETLIIPSLEADLSKPEVSPITAVPPTIETRQPKPILRDLEKRNPDTRQRVNQLMDEIKEKHVPLPATSAQLGSCFRIRPKQIEMWVREGWLRPIAKRQGHDTFHLEEVIAILFFRKSGTNFNKKLVSELHEIIRDEINKRNSQRS